MLKDHDIICMASGNFGGLWVNVQHVMSRLALANRVLYVESVGLRAPKMKSADLGKVVSRVKNFAGGTRKIENGPWVLSPGVIPSMGNKTLEKVNRAWLVRQVKKAARKIGMKNPILWIFLPTASGVAGKLGEKLLVYHVVDEYAANPGVDRQKIEELDRKLTQKADLVFATAPALAEKRKKLNSRTVLVTNVADVKMFSSPGPVPDDLEKIPKPRIGFWGNVAAYKIDIGLIEQTARKKPGWQFVLIGPVGHGDPDTDVSALKKLENVHLTGPRPRKILPSYLAGFDVCILPNVLNETTRGVFPMKFYEYLSQGKPVVSTPLDAIKKTGAAEFVRFGKTPDEFIGEIQRALDEDESRKIARIEMALKNSWEKRIETLSEEVEKQLREKGN